MAIDGDALTQPAAGPDASQGEQTETQAPVSTPEQAATGSEFDPVKFREDIAKRDALIRQHQSKADTATAEVEKYRKRVADFEAQQRDAELQRILNSDPAEIGREFQEKLKQPDMAKVKQEGHREVLDAFLQRARAKFFEGDDTAWDAIASKGLGPDEFLDMLAERAVSRASVRSEAQGNGRAANAAASGRQVPDAGPGGGSVNMTFTTADIEKMSLAEYKKYFRDGRPKPGVRIMARPTSEAVA